MLPVLVQLLHSDHPDLQFQSAQAVMNLSGDPLHALAKYTPNREELIKQVCVFSTEEMMDVF